MLETVRLINVVQRNAIWRERESVCLIGVGTLSNRLIDHLVLKKIDQKNLDGLSGLTSCADSLQRCSWSRRYLILFLAMFCLLFCFYLLLGFAFSVLLRGWLEICIGSFSSFVPGEKRLCFVSFDCGSSLCFWIFYWKERKGLFN